MAGNSRQLGPENVRRPVPGLFESAVVGYVFTLAVIILQRSALDYDT
jgi:hypothetical protein